jgi:hypothetical protein
LITRLAQGAVGREDLATFVAPLAVKLVNNLARWLAVRASRRRGRLMAAAVFLINGFGAIGIDCNGHPRPFIAALGERGKCASGEEETSGQGKSFSKHRWRGEIRGRKKSAQTGIYFIDRPILEWFKVGGSVLIWINSPAHGIDLFISQFYAENFVISSMTNISHDPLALAAQRQSEEFLIVRNRADNSSRSGAARVRPNQAAAKTPGVSPRDLVHLSRVSSMPAPNTARPTSRVAFSLDEFCKMLELKGEGTLVGDAVVLKWNPQRRKRAHAEEHPTYQHVADMVGL